MPPPTNVRVRGIYSTALTALLLQQGYTIVDASPAVQARLRLPYRDALEDVRIADRLDRQGVIVTGGPAHVTDVVRGLQRALPHALFFSDTPGVAYPQEHSPLGLDTRRLRWVQYWAEFPATVKTCLDHLRARILPTLPGHHALKVVDAVAVDAAEVTLAADASQGEALRQRVREALVYRHFQPGVDVLVRHLKAGQSPIELWGQVQWFQTGTLLLERHFQGGGTYDGLRLPKLAGDWGTLRLTEGAWVTVRRYFRRDGTLLGELYNIGTPVEFYPDHLRYVDLELDVVHLPDGTRRLEDEAILANKLARGLLPPALGQEAHRIAVELLQRTIE